MKKVILLLAIAVLTAGTCHTSDARPVPERRLVNIVNSFRGTGGFEIVKVGRLGMTLARSVVGMSEEASDPETKQVLDLIDGVHRVLVVDYEDASERERSIFSSRVGSALASCDLLMSAEDDGSSVNIYGRFDEKSGNVEDLVLFVPEDCALVCVFGKVSMENVGKIAKEMN